MAAAASNVMLPFKEGGNDAARGHVADHHLDDGEVAVHLVAQQPGREKTHADEEERQEGQDDAGRAAAGAFSDVSAVTPHGFFLP